MARLPRAMIPLSSGEGVSRYSYQKAYQLRPGNLIKLGKAPSVPRQRGGGGGSTGAVKAMAGEKFPSGSFGDMFDDMTKGYK